MMRTLETAAGIFGLPARGSNDSGGGSSNHATAAGGGGGGGSSNSLAALTLGGQQRGRGSAQQLAGAGAGPVDTEGLELLMAEQLEEEGAARIAHGAVLARPGIKFIAHELCRERLGGRAGGRAGGRVCYGGKVGERGE